jgi:hypothetical protein
MRQPFVAGNWKMYKTVEHARQLVTELGAGLAGIRGVEKVLCPPFTSLLAVRALLEGTDLGLGAQNMGDRRNRQPQNKSCPRTWPDPDCVCRRDPGRIRSRGDR